MLLAKLNHYEISGVSDDWFKLYLSNCNQYASINGYVSVLGHPLLLLCINNLSQLIKFYKGHHFADDLLYLGNPIKNLNKLANTNLKVVSATFLLVSFLCLKESTCETRKKVFYFTSKALFVLEIIKF